MPVAPLADVGIMKIRRDWQQLELRIMMGPGIGLGCQLSAQVAHWGLGGIRVGKSRLRVTLFVSGLTLTIRVMLNRDGSILSWSQCWTPSRLTHKSDSESNYKTKTSKSPGLESISDLSPSQ